MKLNVKDIITITILTTLSIFVGMLSGMISMVFLTLAFVIGSAIMCFLMAPFYMLTMVKVAKKHTFSIVLIVQMILYSLFGFFQMAIILIPALIVGELILSNVERIKSMKYLIINWTVFSLIYSIHGIAIVLIFGKKYVIESGLFKAEQYDIMVPLMNNPLIVITMIAVTGLGGFLGCLLGKKLLKKHFVKAGVV